MILKMQARTCDKALAAFVLLTFITSRNTQIFAVSRHLVLVYAQVSTCSHRVPYFSKQAALPIEGTSSVLKAWQASLLLHTAMQGLASSSVELGVPSQWQMCQVVGLFIILCKVKHVL